VGYVVAEAAQSVSVSELRRYLAGKLPQYMVPTVWVMLEELPLTASGKVDRRRLPDPQGRPEVGTYVAPRTAVEEALCEIWRETLKVDRVGIQDNFFELGGDSIQSIRIVARAGQRGLSLSVRQMFEHQTIEQLSGQVRVAEEVLAPQGAVRGEYGLTPIQHWYLDEGPGQAHHFNQAMLLRCRREMSESLLRDALGYVLEHHDALRMRFRRQADGQWSQESVEWDGSVPLERIDLCGQAVPAGEEPGDREGDAGTAAYRLRQRADELQGSLDLQSGPLMRMALMDLSAGEQRVLWIIHHLVVDGVSWRVLLEDLGRAYEQLERGEGVQLGSKTSSYQEWSRRLSGYAPAVQQQELSYWCGVHRGGGAGLPLDHAGGENEVRQQETVWVQLDEQQTQELLQRVPQVYHTQINDVLLTALGLALGDWSERERHLIALEGHGREELFAGVDVSRTVGWFTSIYPVQLQVRRAGGVGEALKAVKEQLRRIPQRGVGYGVLRYLTGEGAQQLSEGEQPQLLFNYLGQLDADAEGGARLFGGASEGAGQARGLEGERKYVLEVNGLVSGGRLRMSWGYSRGLHERRSIEGVAQGFVKRLQELIEHCRHSEGGYTPSDFPLLNFVSSR
jgi:non-ribosomal peptide synthase protein (TIGR01720 family)